MKNNIIDNIIQHCNDNYITIISYGLSPNPWGFCYETSDFNQSDFTEFYPNKKTSHQAEIELEKMLESLTSKQEQQLRKRIFHS